MKQSKIERVVDGLKAERTELVTMQSLLTMYGADNIGAALVDKLKVVDALLTRLAETDEADAAPKRTRKARKAGLPESDK